MISPHCILIVDHRIITSNYDPPFRASWDTRPRVSFDATLVRVTTDTEPRSGCRLRRSHARASRGTRSSVRRTGRAGPGAALPHAVEYRLPLRPLLAAGPGPVGSGGQDNRPAVLEELLGGLSNRVRALCFLGHAACPVRPGGCGGTLSGARGFRALKIRFHRGDWRDDVKALEAVRARVGETGWS